ncbi:hypothetical protein COO60DRAFT_404941 [Scenedesmus sp. NREL 46B-D3]|nr:hypothetical protein COO60DRAFT_404941 [Scenedesmus sp. NREL 46B-D3]
MGCGAQVLASCSNCLLPASMLESVLSQLYCDTHSTEQAALLVRSGLVPCGAYARLVACCSVAVLCFFGGWCLRCAAVACCIAVEGAHLTEAGDAVGVIGDGICDGVWESPQGWPRWQPDVGLQTFAGGVRLWGADAVELVRAQPLCARVNRSAPAPACVVVEDCSTGRHCALIVDWQQAPQACGPPPPDSARSDSNINVQQFSAGSPAAGPCTDAHNTAGAGCLIHLHGVPLCCIPWQLLFTCCVVEVMPCRGR